MAPRTTREGHLIGARFDRKSWNLKNLITQRRLQNNGPFKEAEKAITDPTEGTGNSVIMIVTPGYDNGGFVPSHVLPEAVDDFGWEFKRRVPNM
jgi:DNA/RNA non-specific endonuclease